MDYHKSLEDISSSFSETDCTNGNVYDEDKKLHQECVRIQMALKKLSEESEKLAAERKQLEVSFVQSLKHSSPDIFMWKITVVDFEYGHLRIITARQCLRLRSLKVNKLNWSACCYFIGNPKEVIRRIGPVSRRPIERECEVSLSNHYPRIIVWFYLSSLCVG